jgi:hypothetical protein
MVRQPKAAGEQNQINQLMSQGYYEHEAREVALREFILLPEEKVDDEQARELADMEAAYQRNPPVLAGTGDPNEEYWLIPKLRRSDR